MNALSSRTLAMALSICLLSLQSPATVGFVNQLGCDRKYHHHQGHNARSVSFCSVVDVSLPCRTTLRASSGDEDGEDGTFQIEPLAPEDWQAVADVKVDSLERAWRYAKKPLLSIGSKGATLSHGNSLRQLLEQHTVVKVKVNTRRFDGSLQAAFEHLRSLAEENGAPSGIELIQARDADKIILFGLPGTMERIKDGHFPLAEKSEE
mmetsp:Transcript_18115/g.34375  ORF Transcript_18115/g.34375 Transcript_18115/m.34375 type:complete len:207 (-) Transcript_18115:119-739(-)|eukprot:scaffold261_cov170-Amphora_coffeaeformis.AAC.5